MTGLTISAAREEAVDFTEPFFYEPTAIAVTAASIVSVAAYSHCMRLGPWVVLETGLVQEETLDPGPCPYLRLV